ncbi:MAG: hypothetical protein BMS9Abin03_097 [Thermodesulfobacteriota bacterium]|nr:MAG: hypothetical protein BMS9Abin03_097 [Thermodesulfobacteriota bacterium]
MRRVLIIIDVVCLKAVKLLLKYYCHNYRWIQNYIDVIKKAELCPPYLTSIFFNEIVDDFFKKASFLLTD